MSFSLSMVVRRRSAPAVPDPRPAVAWPREEIRDAVLAAALVLFALVFALRMALGADPTEGILMMLGLPIALVAVTRGFAGGVAAAALAMALLLVWAELHEVEMATVAYLSRATTFFLLGGLVGYAVDELRRHAGASADATASRERSEEQLRAVVASVADYAIFMLDRQGRVATWNEGARRLLGYVAEEVVGQHLDRLLTELDRRRHTADANLREAARTGRHFGEGWRVRRDGTRFWAAVETTPHFDDYGAVQGFTHVVRDVTERVEAQERARRSERQLAEAQRMARMGSWELDVLAGRLSWSDQLHRIFGTVRGEPDRTYADFLDRVHPDDRRRVAREIEASLADGRPLEFEARIVRPDGGTRLLVVRGEALRDERGVARMVGTAQDVTEARRAENAFSRAQERFDHWFDGPPTAMALVSLDDGTILQANAAMSALTGRAHAALLGAAIADVLEDADDDAGAVAGLLAGSADSSTGEHRLRRRGGEPLAVKVHGWLLRDEQGEPLYAVLQVQETLARAQAPPPEERPQLSPRELEVIRLVAEGLSGPGIAERLHLSPETIKDHLRSAYRKLGVNERAAAVAQALRGGLID
jgi:PAS domain S-box-containing protein